MRAPERAPGVDHIHKVINKAAQLALERDAAAQQQSHPQQQCGWGCIRRPLADILAVLLLAGLICAAVLLR
jgi:hypothetical protein